MKIIKGILVAIVLIAAIITVVGFLSPSQVQVIRSLKINTPSEVIHAQINNLKNWNNWSPWYKMDTAVIIDYNGIDAGPGASYAWASENRNVGTGDMTIISSSKDSIILTMNFMENGSGTAIFTFMGSDSSTLVAWTMRMDMGGNPIKRAFGLLMDKMLGPDFEKGLTNLKSFTESIPVKPERKFEVLEEELTERIYIIKRDSIPMDSIHSFYEKNLFAIFEAVGKAKLEVAGAPSGLYFAWDGATKTTIMASAIPVKGNAKTKVKGFETYVVPAGKNLRIAYLGGYSSIGMAHMEMDAYMKENNLLQGIPVIEEYVSDPGKEPDSTKWLTNIIYPVK